MNDIIPVAPNGLDPWVAFMQKAVVDPHFDTNKLAALLEMRHREMEQQRIERAEERKQIFSRALTAFQAEVDPIVRDAINPFLKNKYATLAKAVSTAQPFMGKHGLNVRYVSADAPPGWVKLGIIVGHDCGYEDAPFWMSAQTSGEGSKGGKLPMTPGQAVAATVTYLRRQVYINALNLVAGEIEQDDDGEALRGSTGRDRLAGQYEADAPPKPSPDRPEAAWREYVDKLQARLAPLASIAAVEELAMRKSVLDALAHGPQWVKDEIMAMFAEARERALKYAASEAQADDLPPIAGEENLAAG